MKSTWGTEGVALPRGISLKPLVSRWAGAICIALVLWQPQAALAGKVKNIVTDLYGGDGITLSGGTVGHFAHFDATAASGLTDFGGAIASAASIFSLNSTVSAVTYDIERGIPVRTTESLGPILTERSSTLGEAKLNLGLSVSRAVFKKFEGDDLDGLQLDFAHGTGGTTGCTSSTGPGAYCDDFVRVAIDLDIEQTVLALSGTYGVTDNWDVGVVVPLVYVKAEVKASAVAVLDPAGDGSGGITHAFGGGGDQPNDSGKEEAFGVGDVILRTKYDLSDLFESKDKPAMPNLGVLGQVSLATGDEDDLLGLGETAFLGMLIASKQYDWFSPHVNAGYEVTTGASALDNLRYAVGFDARLHQLATGAVDVIGRWHPDGDGSRDIIDFALGIKVDPFDIGAPFSANVLIPLNKNTGLRADVIWSLGFEITF